MNRLRTQVKTMALLCALLGPMLVFMSVVGMLAQHWLQRAVDEGLVPPTPGIIDAAALDFSVRSAVASIPLGLVLLVLGLMAMRDLARGRALLVLAAWISAACMLLLGALWSVTVEHNGLGWAGHLAGWIGHGLQAGLAVITARWLSRDDVRAACSGP